MTTPRDPDALLVSYLADGMEVLPDRVVDAVLDEVHRTPQRAVLGPLMTGSMFKTVFGAAAVFAVLVVGGTLYLGQRSQPAVVAGPSQTPIASPSEPPGPSAGPSAAVVRPAPGLIVFLSGWSGHSGLAVANADGTGKHELVPGACGGWPAWSPDGTRLLISRVDCGAWTNLGDPGTRLYLTDASGTAPQLVDTGCTDRCVSDFKGVFSSDGRRILFLRLIEVPDPSGGTAGKPAPQMQVGVLATLDLATGRVTELAHLPAGSIEATGNKFPAWSPDRTQVVYGRDTMAPSGSPAPFPPVTVMIVADADGGNARQVSPSGWESLSSGWSPDGSLLLFQRNRYTATSAFSDIYTIRPDGSDLRRLTTDGISNGAAWGVDGRIWFRRASRVDADVQTPPPKTYWIMDADGGNATKSSLGPQPQDLADTARQPAP